MVDIIFDADKNCYRVNAENLICPLPVIRVQQALAQLEKGSLLEVTFTDPGALHDIPAWCRIHGYTILATEELDERWCVRIQG